MLMPAFCLWPQPGRWFYNRRMSHARLFTLLVVSVCLGAMLPAGAQTPAPDNKGPATAAAAPAERQTERQTDRRIEHIHIEDAGTRIDELRVGGETQAITVQPKGGMPAYEVVPATGNRSPATAERGSSGASGGTRVWKILGF